MTTPKVTIITATYNWSSVLKYAIESVLWQTFQDFEYLIIGDACTDDSAEVVASFNDPRLRWHNLTQNSGSQSVPNNTGIGMAQGQYIAYLGHDDIWHPAHLESLVRVMETENTDLAFSVTAWIGAPGTAVRRVSGLGLNRQLHGVPPPSSILHRRDVLEQTGLWKDYRTIHIVPDQEFIWRIWSLRRRVGSSAKLTTFKFPAAWRKNAYREKRSNEQAEYVRRIQAEPNFLENEWFDICNSFVTNNNFVPKYVPPPNAGPGWMVSKFRELKGLDAPPDLPVLARPIAKQSMVKRLTNPVKGILRRVLKKLLRMLNDD